MGNVFFLSGNAGYFQISWTLLCGGADFAETCLIFKGKSLSVTLLAAKHCKSAHQGSQQCRPVFPGLLTGPSWLGTQVAAAAGGELQN